MPDVQTCEFKLRAHKEPTAGTRSAPHTVSVSRYMMLSAMPEAHRRRRRGQKKVKEAWVLAEAGSQERNTQQSEKFHHSSLCGIAGQVHSLDVLANEVLSGRPPS